MVLQSCTSSTLSVFHPSDRHRARLIQQYIEFVQALHDGSGSRNAHRELGDRGLRSSASRRLFSDSFAGREDEQRDADADQDHADRETMLPVVFEQLFPMACVVSHTVRDTQVKNHDNEQRTAENDQQRDQQITLPEKALARHAPCSLATAITPMQTPIPFGSATVRRSIRRAVSGRSQA